jgi:integrase/recombinase XerD
MAHIANCGTISTDIVRRYFQYLRLERSYSQNTLDAYSRDLQKLFNYYTDKSINFRNVTLNDLDLFAGQLRENGISARSLARILSGIRSFYRFLVIEKEIQQDPTELLESPKIGLQLPNVLSVEEIDDILSVIDLSKPEGIRDHCIIEILYSCGLRISELTELLISNLFLEEGFIRVLGKWKKERLVPISSRATQELRTWLDVRKHLDIKKGFEDHVFVSRTRGKALSRISLFIFIQQYATQAGINKVISPHTFRHSFATHLLKGGANLRAIQDMLGHESLSTTEIYMNIDNTHLREQMILCHPRNKSQKE